MYRSCYLPLAGMALLLLASGPVGAAPTTTTFYLDNAGSGLNLAGVYTSPYNGQVNYPYSPIVPVICDDFSDESYTPEEWTAYVTTLPQLESGTYGTSDSYLKFGGSGTVTGSDAVTGTWTLTQDQAYDAAAVLAIDILNSSGTAQEDYSYALWSLFDSTDAIGQLMTPAYGVSPTTIATIETDLNTAIGDVQPGAIQSLNAYLSNYNVTIYSYDTGATTCPGAATPCPAAQPQEFITVTTPEASTPLLLGVDLLGFIALVGFLRRRVSLNI